METVRAALRKILYKEAPIRVLDVATGKGEFLKVLIDSSQKSTEFVAIDIKEEYLESAKENFNDVTVSFEVMSADALSFSNEYFDVVSISNTLHHLPQPDLVLSEMKRVLKPDGYLIINEMVSDQQSKKQQSHVSIHHFSAEVDTLLGGFHNRTYDRDELTSLVTNSEFHLLDSLEYIVTQEETEQEIIENVYHAMSQRISQLEDADLRVNYQEELERRIRLIRTVGFELATEVLMIVKKK